MTMTKESLEKLKALCEAYSKELDYLYQENADLRAQAGFGPQCAMLTASLESLVNTVSETLCLDEKLAEGWDALNKARQEAQKVLDSVKEEQ